MTTKRDPNTPKQKTGRKAGVQNYTAKQKAMAMATLDLLNGNMKRTSQVLNIRRMTLVGWRDELERDAVLQAEVIETNEDIVVKLKRLIDSLCVVVLGKAHDASVRDLYYLMGIILDKIENHTKVNLVVDAQNALRQPVAVPLEAPQLVERPMLPESIDAAVARARWELTVDRVIAEADAEGESVSREEAIAAIVRSRPEAKDYLM